MCMLRLFNYGHYYDFVKNRKNEYKINDEDVTKIEVKVVFKKKEYIP